MKLQKNGQSFQVTLPKQIVLAKGWAVGDKLKARITEKGDLLIQRV